MSKQKQFILKGLLFPFACKNQGLHSNYTALNVSDFRKNVLQLPLIEVEGIPKRIHKDEADDVACTYRHTMLIYFQSISYSICFFL